MRFDLADLRLYIHTADSGSITAGARLAHLALPSASARIRAMEEMLEVRLFERGRRGVQLTEAGRALQHHARLLLRQMEDMRADLADFASGLKGHLRILCNTSAMTEFLPDALAGFIASHPHINIDLEERLSTAIVAAVTDGTADLGIVADTVDTSALHTLPFRDDKLVLAMAPTHALARQLKRKSGIAFADALDHDFIGLAGDSALQQYAAVQAARLGRRMNCRIRLRSFEAVCRMAAGGSGLALLPEVAARRSAQAGALKVVQLNDSWAARKLLICMRDYAALPAYARKLADTLAAGHTA
jgi:DNA-binding transcriptional LysR family regulator